MMMMEDCYHMCHSTCFMKYAKKTLLSKKANGDFNDCVCGRCGKVVDEASLREILGADLDNIRD